MTSTIYPTGTISYNPEKCWNGFTVYQTKMFGGDDGAAALIDMNGNMVNLWDKLDGHPNKILPGGYIMGSTGMRDPRYGYQDMADLIQVDWEGNIVWRFNRYDKIEDPGQDPRWMSRQHHDYQREGNPVGYYAPGMDPMPEKGNTLMLCHKNIKDSRISDKTLINDTIIEVTWDGEMVWEWSCAEHFDELGFSQEAKETMARYPNIKSKDQSAAVDWMHMNSISLLGPNRWYDEGDERFHPDNIIFSGRQTNIMGIIDKKTGRIVWQLGPDYSATPALKKLGWIIGQHHAHMIPRGLPGEGNILIFDNGGWAGYGAPNPGSPTGFNNALRDFSRVIEIDPNTLEIVWKCGGRGVPMFDGPGRTVKLYSVLVSSAQRLPNGNTLITEGSCGRLIEVTPENEIVWEYISPVIHQLFKSPAIYRAYRLPYEWAPQAKQPMEKAIQPPDISQFNVPGAPPTSLQKKTALKL